MSSVDGRFLKELADGDTIVLVSSQGHPYVVTSAQPYFGEEESGNAQIFRLETFSGSVQDVLQLPQAYLQVVESQTSIAPGGRSYVGLRSAWAGGRFLQARKRAPGTSLYSSLFGVWEQWEQHEGEPVSGVCDTLNAGGLILSSDRGGRDAQPSIRLISRQLPKVQLQFLAISVSRCPVNVAWQVVGQNARLPAVGAGAGAGASPPKGMHGTDSGPGLPNETNQGLSHVPEQQLGMGMRRGISHQSRRLSDGWSGAGLLSTAAATSLIALRGSTEGWLHAAADCSLEDEVLQLSRNVVEGFVSRVTKFPLYLAFVLWAGHTRYHEQTQRRNYLLALCRRRLTHLCVANIFHTWKAMTETTREMYELLYQRSCQGTLARIMVDWHSNTVQRMRHRAVLQALLHRRSMQLLNRAMAAWLGLVSDRNTAHEVSRQLFSIHCATLLSSSFDAWKSWADSLQLRRESASRFTSLHHKQTTRSVLIAWQQLSTRKARNGRVLLYLLQRRLNTLLRGVLLEWKCLSLVIMGTSLLENLQLSPQAQQWRLGWATGVFQRRQRIFMMRRVTLSWLELLRNKEQRVANYVENRCTEVKRAAVICWHQIALRTSCIRKIAISISSQRDALILTRAFNAWLGQWRRRDILRMQHGMASGLWQIRILQGVLTQLFNLVQQARERYAAVDKASKSRCFQFVRNCLSAWFALVQRRRQAAVIFEKVCARVLESAFSAWKSESMYQLQLQQIARRILRLQAAKCVTRVFHAWLACAKAPLRLPSLLLTAADSRQSGDIWTVIGVAARRHETAVEFARLVMLQRSFQAWHGSTLRDKQDRIIVTQVQQQCRQQCASSTFLAWLHLALDRTRLLSSILKVVLLRSRRLLLLSVLLSWKNEIQAAMWVRKSAELAVNARERKMCQAFVSAMLDKVRHAHIVHQHIEVLGSRRNRKMLRDCWIAWLLECRILRQGHTAAEDMLRWRVHASLVSAFRLWRQFAASYSAYTQTVARIVAKRHFVLLLRNVFESWRECTVSARQLRVEWPLFCRAFYGWHTLVQEKQLSPKKGTDAGSPLRTQGGTHNLSGLVPCSEPSVGSLQHELQASSPPLAQRSPLPVRRAVQLKPGQDILKPTAMETLMSYKQKEPQQEPQYEAVTADILKPTALEALMSYKQQEPQREAATADIPSPSQAAATHPGDQVPRHMICPDVNKPITFDASSSPGSGFMRPPIAEILVMPARTSRHCNPDQEMLSTLADFDRRFGTEGAAKHRNTSESTLTLTLPETLQLTSFEHTRSVPLSHCLERGQQPPGYHPSSLRAQQSQSYNFLNGQYTDIKEPAHPSFGVGVLPSGPHGRNINPHPDRPEDKYPPALPASRAVFSGAAHLQLVVPHGHPLFRAVEGSCLIPSDRYQLPLKPDYSSSTRKLSDLRYEVERDMLGATKPRTSPRASHAPTRANTYQYDLLRDQDQPSLHHASCLDPHAGKLDEASKLCTERAEVPSARAQVAAYVDVTERYPHDVGTHAHNLAEGFNSAINEVQEDAGTKRGVGYDFPGFHLAVPPGRESDERSDPVVMAEDVGQAHLGHKHQTHDPLLSGYTSLLDSCSRREPGGMSKGLDSCMRGVSHGELPPQQLSMSSIFPDDGAARRRSRGLAEAEALQRECRALELSLASMCQRP
eukprot:gene1686-33082_t